MKVHFTNLPVRNSSKIQENIVVYEALREHILHKEDEMTNETIYMFVTYFALLAAGNIWNSWLSLISFIDLIVFQSIINESQWSVTKASMYIITFFESKRNDIHWELLHHDPFYLSVWKETNVNIGWYIYRFGTSLLSIISLLTILIPPLHSANYQFNALPTTATAQIFIAIALCLVTVYINTLYFSVQGNKELHGKVEQAIIEFYNKY